MLKSLGATRLRWLRTSGITDKEYTQIQDLLAWMKMADMLTYFTNKCTSLGAKL